MKLLRPRDAKQLPCVTERAGVLASRPGSGGSWLVLAFPGCPRAAVSLSEPLSLHSSHACGPDGYHPICPDVRTNHYSQLHTSGLQCKPQRASWQRSYWLEWWGLLPPGSVAGLGLWRVGGAASSFCSQYKPQILS